MLSEGNEKKWWSIPLRWRLEIDRLLNEMRRSPHFGEVRTLGDGDKAVKKYTASHLAPYRIQATVKNPSQASQQASKSQASQRAPKGQASQQVSENYNVTCYITDVWKSPEDKPFISTSGAKLLVEAPNSELVKHAMGKVLSLLEEEAVDLVIGGSNNDEAVTNVVWGDNTMHAWGLAPGGHQWERLKADLELVGIFGLQDELPELMNAGLSKERREQLVGKVEKLRETCEERGVPRRSILGGFLRLE